MLRSRQGYVGDDYAFPSRHSAQRRYLDEGVDTVFPPYMGRRTRFMSYFAIRGGNVGFQLGENRRPIRTCQSERTDTVVERMKQPGKGERFVVHFLRFQNRTGENRKPIDDPVTHLNCKQKSAQRV